MPSVRTGRPRLAVAAFVFLLCLVAGSAARGSEAASTARLQLGILGNASRFTQLTGQRRA